MFKTFQLFFITICLGTYFLSCASVNNQSKNNAGTAIIPGAERVNQYLPLISDKNIGIVANHTSLINGVHLVDSLLAHGVHIVRIFSPEHGFRGNLDAGMKYDSYKDKETGLPVVSLYGKNRKPADKDMEGIDIIIFDIQDVGVRFYTYLSTMHYVMEACARNHIDFLVLDRPNPNGFYVDGPVLNMKYQSFVGMHPVPLVHGMTVAEYAAMINGEGWLGDDLHCKLKWVLCSHYDHSAYYTLPVNPSPNLQDMIAVYLYPSLGLFEGTVMSVGRGTDFPFKVYGHPDLNEYDFQFTPESRPGYASNPKYKGKSCNGFDLRNIPVDSLRKKKMINLHWIKKAYHLYPRKDEFFTSFFYYLSGTKQLRNQIIEGVDIQRIRDGWQPELNHFKEVRKKYLLYNDFE